MLVRAKRNDTANKAMKILLGINNKLPTSVSSFLLFRRENIMAEKYKIVHRWKSGTHREMTVEWNGHSYHVIYGTQVNGGFCCIPNWMIGCELATFTDVLWNAGSLGRALKSKRAGRAIAEAIASETEE